MKLFTHTDLDGVGCVVLARFAFDKFDYEMCNYDDINEKVNKWLDTEIDKTELCCITDISVNEETAERLNKRGNVILLDHHATALWLNDKYDWATVKIENDDGIKTCGTELFYNFIIDYMDEIETFINWDYDFVQLVRNYDTWQWTEIGDKGLNSKKLNDLYYIYGADQFISWCWEQSVEHSNHVEFDNISNKLLEYKQKEIDDYIAEKEKQLQYINIDGYNAGLVFAEKYTSQLGNTICNLHPEIDFVAIIDMSDNTIGYRTNRDDIHLGMDIAKKRNGGGHAKAAGSKFDENLINEFIKNLF